MRKVTILTALLLAAPGFAQAASLEDLLVDKGVITKSEMAGVVRGAHHDHGQPGRVYWNKGSELYFPEQEFTAKVYTQLQTKYEYTDYDSDDTDNADTSSFDV